MPPATPTFDRPWPSLSAPYPDRPHSRSSRQRAVSQHERSSPSDIIGHGYRRDNHAGRFDYFAAGAGGLSSSPTEEARRGSTSSSDGSFSSYVSQRTPSTAATSMLSESPSALPPHLLQRHLHQAKLDRGLSLPPLERGLSLPPLPPLRTYTADLPDAYDEPLTQLTPSRRPRARRSSVSAAGGRLPPLPPLDATLSRHGMLPPLPPLRLDTLRAQGLEPELESSHTLPPPWLSLAGGRVPDDGITGAALRPSLRVNTEAARRARAGSLGAALERTRSRSPDTSTRMARSNSMATSSVPHDLPKEKFVEGLIGAACTAIEVVWKSSSSSSGTRFVGGLPTPASSPISRTGPTSTLESVLPLRQFIREVLRRSRSTCSTLQTALYYIHKSRDAIREKVRLAEEANFELQKIRMGSDVDEDPLGLPSLLFDDVRTSPMSSARRTAELLEATRSHVLCGRRMFLAALICASKFLQDKNYCNRAWARITSLPVQEINANEKAFLQLMDYNLFIDAELFKNWACRLQVLAQQQDRRAASSAMSSSTSSLPPVSHHHHGLPRPKLPPINTAVREGLSRSHSVYTPPPEPLDVTRAGLPPLSSSELYALNDGAGYLPRSLSHGRYPVTNMHSSVPALGSHYRTSRW